MTFSFDDNAKLAFYNTVENNWQGVTGIGAADMKNIYPNGCLAAEGMRFIKAIQYIKVFGPSGGGSPQLLSYNDYDSQDDIHSLKAVPNDGFEFIRWCCFDHVGSKKFFHMIH